MKTFVLLLAAVGIFAPSAQAARPTYSKTYATATGAALAAGASHFNKSNKRVAYSSRNVYIAKKIASGSAITRKFLVKSNDGLRQKTVTIQQKGSRKFRFEKPVLRAKRSPRGMRGNRPMYDNPRARLEFFKQQRGIK